MLARGFGEAGLLFVVWRWGGMDWKRGGRGGYTYLFSSYLLTLESRVLLGWTRFVRYVLGDKEDECNDR